MPRTRLRPALYPHYFIGGGSAIPLSPWTREYMSESGRRPCQVGHYKTMPYNGTLFQYGGQPYSLYDYEFISLFNLNRILEPVYRGMHLSLNRKKLNSTNEFGLLQFIAELDDTIALFTKKFWTSLSYGSFTWGVLPFVSEVRKLLEFLAKAPKSFGTGQRYEDQLTKVGSLEYDAGGSLFHTVSYNIVGRYSGNILYPVGKEAQMWLDRLGFHPDINTAWDLLPLSFMVDWFLPVGDFISSLKQSGWVDNVAFSGWNTVKTLATVTPLRYTAGTLLDATPITISKFDRYKISSILVLTQEPTPDLVSIQSHFATGADPLKVLFNTCYLLFSGRSKK